MKLHQFLNDSSPPQYQGAELTDAQHQNQILMMLLRAHFETRQASHTHTALPGGGVRWAGVGDLRRG